MTDKTIQKIIDWLNTGAHPEDVSCVPLVGNVALGRVSPKVIEVPSHVEYRFFFILDDLRCVGAVLDMEDDLHCLTLSEYQRKGLMGTALRDTVLPFLAAEGRITQRLTFNPRNDAVRFLVASLSKTYRIIHKESGEIEHCCVLELGAGSFESQITLWGPPNQIVVALSEIQHHEAGHVVAALVSGCAGVQVTMFSNPFDSAVYDFSTLTNYSATNTVSKLRGLMCGPIAQIAHIKANGREPDIGLLLRLADADIRRLVDHIPDLLGEPPTLADAQIRLEEAWDTAVSLVEQNFTSICRIAGELVLGRQDELHYPGLGTDSDQGISPIVDIEPLKTGFLHECVNRIKMAGVVFPQE